MKAYRWLVVMVCLAMVMGPGAQVSRGQEVTSDECYYSFEKSYILYLPIIRKGDMPNLGASRLAAAKERLRSVLGQTFQNRVAYRQGVVDNVTIAEDGRIQAATMTVDGVQSIPFQVPPGIAIHVGDSIQVENRGSPASPEYVYDLHRASAYAAAGTSPAATLPTPTGLTLTTTLRVPTTGGQVATITATWRALADAVMGDGGYYEIEIKRNVDTDGHVSECPHRLGSTQLDGSATYNDASITVDDTTDFPSSGRIKVSDAEISYTGKTSTTFTGLTWHSGSGTYADDTEVTGLTITYIFDHVATGTTYNVRVRAVSVTGAVSDWTSWASISTDGDQQLYIEDRFDQYGGSATSPLESLWWLRVATADSDETWTGATGYGDLVDGDGSQGLTVTPGNSGNIGYSRELDLDAEGRFGDDDYFVLVVDVDNPTYLETVGNGGMLIGFLSGGPPNPTYFARAPIDKDDLVSGINFIKLTKSYIDTYADANFDWGDVIGFFFGIEVLSGAGGSVTAKVDDLRLVKADEADGDVYNDTGTTWDFDPQQGDTGPEWHIYEGNRAEEPAKPFSLGQIKTDLSPADWYLAYHTLADVYYGTAVIGVFLKAADGEAALAFNIQDPASATRTEYAVEIDTANNKVRLVRWVDGVRTQIAEADFTCTYDELIWLGVDFRDFDSEDRIKVYATLTEGNVIQAANLVISETDSNVDQGGYVGVMAKEANVRFVDFRAGSPQHAMTAEVAFFAEVAARLKAAEIIIEDQQTSGTDGGGFTSGSWQTRTLNTIVHDDTDEVSLSSNQFTLPPGTYWIRASAPAYNVDRHAIRLYNITDSAVELSGSSEFAPTDQTRSHLTGIIEISASKTFEVQHRCQSTQATYGFGVACGTSFTVDHETYTRVVLHKIA